MEPVSIHPGPPVHSLEPLTADEVAAASGILKREQGLAATARFVFISLDRAFQGRAGRGGHTAARGAHRLYEKSSGRRTRRSSTSTRSAS